MDAGFAELAGRYCQILRAGRNRPQKQPKALFLRPEAGVRAMRIPAYLLFFREEKS
jgi:hypothetical protein